jgi:hypothetical protein
MTSVSRSDLNGGVGDRASRAREGPDRPWAGPVEARSLPGRHLLELGGPPEVSPE